MVEKKSDYDRSSTAYFDIRRTIYKVWRSLLEAFPGLVVAHPASDTRQRDTDTPIFIAGTGGGRMDLSPCVAKEALLIDLDCYGFENVNLDAKSTDGCSTFGAATIHLVSVEHDYQTLLSCMELAHVCFQQHTLSVHMSSNELSAVAKEGLCYVDSPLFQQSFAKYGLQYMSHSGPYHNGLYYYLYLSKLSATAK
jgi:hypothetical protein